MTGSHLPNIRGDSKLTAKVTELRAITLMMKDRFKVEGSDKILPLHSSRQLNSVTMTVTFALSSNKKQEDGVPPAAARLVAEPLQATPPDW